MDWFRHHIGDYARDTSHLSPLQDGVYHRMIRLYYADEKPLGLNIDRLCRRIGCSQRHEKAAVALILEEFFEMQEDGYHQARCDAEIAGACVRSEIARTKGKASGLRRAQKLLSYIKAEEQLRLTYSSAMAQQELDEQFNSPAPAPAPLKKDAAPTAAASGDLTKTMFDQGIAYLTGTGVKSDQQARALLGKWKKALGSDGSLIELLATAQRQGVVEPVGWMTKAIQAREPTTPSRGWN